MLQDAVEPLITWSQPPIELLKALSSFGTIGAIGFRFVVARRLLTNDSAIAGTTMTDALRRAARIACVATLLGALALALDLWATASEKQLALSAVVAKGGPALVGQLALLALMAIAFALAARGAAPGWPIALVATTAYALRAIVSLKWTQIVNPLHVVGGGLWIGTLFVLFAAGVPAVMRGPAAQRGRAVADLVNAFSPLALVSTALLASMGVVTAWRHLKRVDALWTTPYGYTLLVKLTLVAMVLALGAYNWRRMRPRLGGEASANAIKTTAGRELAVAAVVLLVTSILVSLPTPKG
ncbi:MAG: CopD family protein [Gemmatimonadaceae bacterium]